MKKNHSISTSCHIDLISIVLWINFRKGTVENGVMVEDGILLTFINVSFMALFGKFLFWGK